MNKQLLGAVLTIGTVLLTSTLQAFDGPGYFQTKRMSIDFLGQSILNEEDYGLENNVGYGSDIQFYVPIVDYFGINLSMGVQCTEWDSYVEVGPDYFNYGGYNSYYFPTRNWSVVECNNTLNTGLFAIEGIINMRPNGSVNPFLSVGLAAVYEEYELEIMERYGAYIWTEDDTYATVKASAGILVQANNIIIVPAANVSKVLESEMDGCQWGASMMVILPIDNYSLRLGGGYTTHTESELETIYGNIGFECGF